MSNPKKLRVGCLMCGKEQYRAYYKYCSNVCQREFQHQAYIRSWKEGKNSGLNTIGLVSKPVKRYLRDKFGNRCALCRWAKVNPKTQEVPLVADHVDGNWRNNTEGNLRLLCPNCDALSPTYAGSNIGKGMPGRARSRRAQEGKILAKKRK